MKLPAAVLILLLAWAVGGCRTPGPTTEDAPGAVDRVSFWRGA